MTYGIQLVHQNPAFKKRDATQPLWWQGPLRDQARGEEWHWSYPPTDEGRFANEQAALERARQMTPFAVARIVLLA